MDTPASRATSCIVAAMPVLLCHRRLFWGHHSGSGASADRRARLHRCRRGMRDRARDLPATCPRPARDLPATCPGPGRFRARLWAQYEAGPTGKISTPKGAGSLLVAALVARLAQQLAVLLLGHALAALLDDGAHVSSLSWGAHAVPWAASSRPTAGPPRSGESAVTLPGHGHRRVRSRDPVE